MTYGKPKEMVLEVRAKNKKGLGYSESFDVVLKTERTLRTAKAERLHNRRELLALCLFAEGLPSTKAFLEFGVEDTAHAGLRFERRGGLDLNYCL